MTSVAEPSQQAWVERCVRGDPDALAWLYDRYAPVAWRYLTCLRLGLDDHRIQDAVQETFVRLLTQLPRLERATRLEAYVLGLARNVAIDLVRRDALRRPAGEPSGEASGAPAPVDSALSRERGGLVADALAALDAQHATTLALRFVGELTMAELAVALEVSVPTARARLREAASRLALELRRRGVDPQEGA
jgi:RNA polymerase sigma-70 factor (ECF subfamily)